MTLFEELKNHGLNKIKEFLVSQTSETQKLEFKRTLQLKPNGVLENEGKRNLSKQVSGFANGAGGILIHGIQTVKLDGADIASTLHPITNIDSYKNRVEAAISELIAPEITGIELLVIQDDKDARNGYLVFSIPQSDLRPHMATASKEHKYYRRGLESTVIMDHSQVRDMFFTQKNPKLEHNILPVWAGNSGNIIILDFLFSLKNIAQTPAKNPVLRIEYTPRISNIATSNFSTRTMNGKVSYFLKENDILYLDDEAIFARPRVFLQPDIQQLSNLTDVKKNSEAKKPSSWFFSLSRSNTGIMIANPRDNGFDTIAFDMMISAENGTSEKLEVQLNVGDVFPFINKDNKLNEWIDRMFPLPPPK